MTVAAWSSGAPLDQQNWWKSIEWKTVKSEVRRLQVRIAKAVKEGRWGKVKALQWLLTHSFYAKLLAVKHVTSNKGKRTSGVDGEIWSTHRQKMRAVGRLRRRAYRPKPLRRIHIPKKNGKKRPLSIPIMLDRAMQALYKRALDPVAETMADPNSYGFRWLRRCADAIGQCFVVLAKSLSPRWVLEADIKACFDEISHKWILENVPMDKRILEKWLTSGYMEDNRLYPSHKGTPQGGIISPVLANMTLDGLEQAAVNAVPNRISGNIRSKVNVVRYADDFIITGDSRKLLEEEVKPAVEAFLSERGLSLSEEKTRIVPIERGFDFLGQTPRKYEGKLLIKPSRSSVQAFLRDLKATIRKHGHSKVEVLINALNPKIRGWANYHRHVVSGRVFGFVDNWLYHQLWKWMKRRHRKKRKSWLVENYWMKGATPWTFSATVEDEHGNVRSLELVKLHTIGIRRHVKIRGDANPYDPKYQNYFRKRHARGFTLPGMRGRRRKTSQPGGPERAGLWNA